MANIICISCMKGTLNEQGVCNVCGKSDSAVAGDRRHLPPRTILRGKYLIGEAIGGGGFGITYLAFDLDLEIRVAVKEFFPRDFVGRDTEDRLTLLPYEGECGTFFEAEKEKFINEAKRLAKFRGKPGIVSVLDYFQENGTAYIVMEYIEGATLRAYHMATGSALDVQAVLRLMKPVIAILDMVHQEGIIHRDISPDNIMINPKEEKVYLIDFGTAREASLDGERSLSVYMKHGYTPAEQRSRHGVQGPWTDVYALCATIYRCITNRYVPEVNDRIFGEELIKPSDMGIAISPQVEAALLHGLAIKPEDRIQSMAQLMFELYGGLVVHADNKHEPYDKEVKETNGSGYQSAVVKKASELVPDKSVQIFEEGNRRAGEPKRKGNKVRYVLLVICILVMTVVFSIIMNGEYRNDAPTKDFYSIDKFSWGTVEESEFYSKDGKKISEVNYVSAADSIYDLPTITHSLYLDNWVTYVDGKISEFSLMDIKGEIVEYRSNADYVISWKYKHGKYENEVLATTTVKNGELTITDSDTNNIFGNRFNRTRHWQVEYDKAVGMTVKSVGNDGKTYDKMIFKDNEKLLLEAYSSIEKKRYVYQFENEDSYLATVENDNENEKVHEVVTTYRIKDGKILSVY